MKTAESRLPKIEPANGEQTFTLQFSKADADALASCLDVTVKAAGIQAIDAAQVWLSKVREAMTIANKT